MRYQQQQRNNNKTERQRYEANCLWKRELSHNAFLEFLNSFKLAYKKFNEDSKEFNLTLDWDTFLTKQNNYFTRILSRQRKRGSNMQYQQKDIIRWNHLISTFKNAAQMHNQVAANNRYNNAQLILNNYQMF